MSNLIDLKKYRISRHKKSKDILRIPALVILILITASVILSFLSMLLHHLP